MPDVLLAAVFNRHVLVPTLILGIATAGLYGLLTVSMVVTYRVSRTIGFVQGGIVFMGTFLYYWLASPRGEAAGAGLPDIGAAFEVNTQARLGTVSAMLLVVLAGAVVGAVYGISVTGKRMANWPRIVLTTYSLAGLLGLTGLTLTAITPHALRVNSPFGTDSHSIFGTVVTSHQVATVVIPLLLVALLAFVLHRTRTGVYIRAIADDVEASRFLGIRLHTVGTAVYALSGAIAALAGVLLASTVGTDPGSILFVFLRALLAAVLGGFTSLGLALAGCLLLAVGETMLTGGVFGAVSPANRELLIMTVLFGLVFIINRFRPVRVLEATGL